MMPRRMAVVAAFLLALTGCVTLPESGPVRSGPTSGGTGAAAPFDYNPPGPTPGADPEVVVQGFLNALEETPLTTTVARQFLTQSSRSQWQPSRRTVIYADGQLETQPRGARVVVRIGSSVQLDSRGSWLGDPTGGNGLQYVLRLTREAGEWRIENPPDALIVPRSLFDTRFVRYDLHFFDPTGQVLVPEPVYLAAGVQAPSLLVSGLLAGPSRRLRSVERSFFPPGTALDLSVPVSGGVAEIPLTSEVLDLDSQQLDRAMAQLAWTLRQVPGIDRMRVTVGGTPVDRTTGAAARSLLAWSSYDPSVPSASGDLFALQDGTVVTVPDGDETEVVTEAFATDPVRSIGVSATADEVMAVTEDGRRALRLDLSGSEGSGEKRPPRTVYTGTDLLRPVWDVFGCAWLVDRRPSGASVTTLCDDRRLELRAPGIAGADVTAFTVSRDGTRLAAVVDGRVMVGRVSRQGDGLPTRVEEATSVPLGQEITGRVRDLAWATPASLAVLVRLGPAISQVAFTAVDGSAVLDTEAPSLEPLFERAGVVATWPGADAPLYVRADSGRVFEVSRAGNWSTAGLPEGLRALTFPAG